MKSARRLNTAAAITLAISSLFAIGGVWWTIVLHFGVIDAKILQGTIRLNFPADHRFGEIESYYNHSGWRWALRTSHFLSVVDPTGKYVEITSVALPLWPLMGLSAAWLVWGYVRSRIHADPTRCRCGYLLKGNTGTAKV